MKERFKELRKNLDLSQTDFAERMGVTRSVINNIERGVVEPKEYLVNLVCKTYGANRAWLETGEGEMFYPEMDDVLGLLAQKYQLDERKTALIRAYLEMPQDKQEAVLAYAEGVVDALRLIGQTSSVDDGKSSVDDEEKRYEEAIGARRRHEPEETG